MNWEAIGAIGELVGAIGVIATLIYLAIQIRQSSRNIESQNIHAHTQQMQQVMALQARPEMATAIKKAYVTGDALNTEEDILLEAYLLSRIAAVRDDFLHFQEGFISQEEWQQRKRRFAPFFISENAKNLWRASGEYYETAFCAELNELVDTPIDHNYIDALYKKADRRAGEDQKGL